MKNRSILLKKLLEHGYRIFSLKNFEEIATSLGYSKLSLRQLIFEMKKDGSIHMIRSGIYHIDNNFLGTPISSYETGLALVEGSYLSYLSAISLHQLTDQIPNIVYLSIEHKKYSKHKKIKNNNYNDCDYYFNGTEYKIIEIKKELIFGIEDKLIGEYKLRLTNLERTLIDALNQPNYCGGFMEVLSYFEHAKQKLDVHKLINYASHFSTSCLQRLGWCLEKIGITDSVEEIQSMIKTRTMVKLDVSGLRRGRYNKKWYIIENI